METKEKDKYRMVPESHERDPIIMGLSCDGLNLFKFYNQTSLSDFSGLYPVSGGVAAHYTKMPIEQVEKAHAELIASGLIEYDDAFQIIWVKRMLREQAILRKEKMSEDQQKHVWKQLRKYAACPLAQKLLKEYRPYLNCIVVADDGSILFNPPTPDRPSPRPTGKRSIKTLPKDPPPKPSTKRVPPDPLPLQRTVNTEQAHSEQAAVTSQQASALAENTNQTDKHIYMPPLEKEVVEYWNQNCGELSKVELPISVERKSRLAKRLKNPNFVKNWKEGIRRLAKSDYCNGGGKDGWRADFDYLVKSDSTIEQLMEGKYANRKSQPSEPGRVGHSGGYGAGFSTTVGGQNIKGDPEWSRNLKERTERAKQQAREEQNG